MPLLLLLLAAVAATGETIQIDVKAVLDGRSVTTLSGGTVVTWNAEVGYGATGGCGYMTTAAWKQVNTTGKQAVALPDDGVFPATATRPRVVLNYTDADGASAQTRTVRGSGEFAFAVAPARFERFLLFFSAAPILWTDIVVTATYADGGEAVLPTRVPEFSLRVRRPLPDARWSVLVDDVGKWDARNVCREPGHHFIDALDLQPDPGRTLTRITVVVKPESPKGILTFWGATGVTSGDPPAQRP